ncbi:MAG: 30S ribosomal protein S4, partial [Firmicutes bacterium]|nr:30S ribosomal protein S4 [Bacillota bacterium]
RTYGLLERQFRRYYDLAARRRGITGENLLQLLETRLDNVVYRLGFASSRPEARQLVLHGHFSVNGRKVTVPSYQVRPGDVVAIREGSRNLDKFKVNLEVGRTTPPWMTLDLEKMEGEILSLPTRDQIDVPVQEHLIVEYYSR